MREFGKPHHDAGHVIEGEKVLLESDDAGMLGSTKLTVTTHRVMFKSKKLGRENFKSIMLEDVCSCEVRYNSSLLLLVIGAVLLLLSISFEGMLKWGVLI